MLHTWTLWECGLFSPQKILSSVLKGVYPKEPGRHNRPEGARILPKDLPLVVPIGDKVCYCGG